MMRQTIKRLLVRYKPLLRLLNKLTGNFPKILVYHRFSPNDTIVPHRVNAETFAWQLDVLMRDFEVISLGECIVRFQKANRWPRGTAVLTIDDGYRDMYEVAWPELAKRNLPATFFVTTEFIDGTLWLWPDRLQYALNQTHRTECTICMSGQDVRVLFNTEQLRARAWQIFSDYCIALSDKDRLRFIRQVEQQLGVELPLTPPPEYAAVTWEQLREMHDSGIEVGGHTMTHPILSKLDGHALYQEISGCRNRIRERLSIQAHSFCYPNSGPGDINATVIDAVSSAGFNGAVFGTNLTAWDRYQIPRMAISDERIDFLWKLYGGEALSYWGRTLKRSTIRPTT
jgi:peptidoglycan/xylan/chitin deacetylase (PgdA/CDA1 family)